MIRLHPAQTQIFIGWMCFHLCKTDPKPSARPGACLGHETPAKQQRAVFLEIQLFLFLMNEIKVGSKSATVVCTHIFLLRLWNWHS